MIRDTLARAGVVAAVVLVASGCTASDPGATSSPGSTPAPTAWSAPPPPSAQIPASCDDLVSAATAADFSTPARTPEQPWYDAGSAAAAAATAQAGTLTCAWSADATSTVGDLWITVERGPSAFPPFSDGAPEPGLGADESSLSCSGSSPASCNVRATVGEFGVIAGASRDTADATSFRDDFVAVMAGAVGSLGAAAAPGAWEAPAGAWPLEVDCAAVAAVPSFATEAGWTDAVVDSQFGNAPLFGRGGLTSCPWVDSARTSGVIGVLAAGGSWFWPTFAELPGFVELDIPGAEAAGVVCDGSAGSCQATAVVGVNLVSVIGSGDLAGSGADVADRLGRELAGVVAGLNAVY